MRFKAAAFDIDGILCRSEHLQYWSWVEALKPYRIKFGKKAYAPYCGKTGAIIAKELCQTYGLQISPQKLLDRKEILIKKWIKNSRLLSVPHVREALRFFKARKLPLVAVSGIGRAEAELKLRKLKMDKFFTARISRDEVKKSKPHPVPYLAACKALNLSPKNVIAFEDTPPGIQSASDAGLFTIAIPSCYSKGQNFSKADLVCGNFKEALAALKKIMRKC